MTSLWRKYILWFAQEHVEFRKAEIESITKLLNIRMKHLSNINGKDPFWIIELPDLESAQKLASRSISLKCIIEYWAEGKSILKLHENIQNFTKTNKDSISNLFDKNKSFKITVETYNKHFTQKEKVEKIENFDYLDVKGMVDLKNPDTNLWYIEFYGIDPLNVPNHPDYVFFGKWIGDGQRKLLKDLSLKKRKFIGNTSMDPQLSVLMANQALVKPGDFVFDPFVGSGSLLVPAAKFGAFVLGSDIDFLMLHGRTKPSRITQKVREADESVKANLIQYNCENLYVDCIVSDFSLPVWRDDIKFDSIITDPPYGIRESTEKVESKSTKKMQTNNDEIHFPSTSAYNLDELFYDLLLFAVKHLKIRGRLVCWVPFYRDDYNEELIPKHASLSLVSNSEQILSGFTARRLLTYEKISENLIDNNIPDTDNSMDFRAKYFYHGEETRKERRMMRAKLRETGKQEALKRGKLLDENGKVFDPKYL